MAREVGLPIDPPDRNVNSRFALETAELVRATRGDGLAGAFHHAVSRAFFVERADISKRDVVVPIAVDYDVPASDVDAAWQERRFRGTVDRFIDEAHTADATGVPAIAWPNHKAIVGMMRPGELVLLLGNESRTR